MDHMTGGTSSINKLRSSESQMLQSKSLHCINPEYPSGQLCRRICVIRIRRKEMFLEDGGELSGGL